MAFRKQIFCPECKTHTEIIVGSGQQSTFMLICDSCREDELKTKKQKHLAGLKVLSIEERISKLEEWTYHHK